MNDAIDPDIWAAAQEQMVVAEVFDPVSGDLYDSCYTWEAGQTYAHQNYKVIATKDDGYMTKEMAQSLYDNERALSQDCFNLSDTEVTEG